jgi:hypothetical protein
MLKFTIQTLKCDTGLGCSIFIYLCKVMDRDIQEQFSGRQSAVCPSVRCTFRFHSGATYLDRLPNFQAANIAESKISKSHLIAFSLVHFLTESTTGWSRLATLIKYLFSVRIRLFSFPVSQYKLNIVRR